MLFNMLCTLLWYDHAVFFLLLSMQFYVSGVSIVQGTSIEPSAPVLQCLINTVQTVQLHVSCVHVNVSEIEHDIALLKHSEHA
jgi:hypothetical protein